MIILKHGGDIYTEGILKGKSLLDFSSNINPLGVPESFRDHIQEALESAIRYPDLQYRCLKEYIENYLQFSRKYFTENTEEDLNKKSALYEIKEKLSYRNDKEKEKYLLYNNVNVRHLVLGNGAAEIIDLVISCFKSICIVIPSFVEYELNASKWGCEIEYSYLDVEMNYDYEDIALKLKKVEALIIGNPNNPNGGVIDKYKFKSILDYCENNGKTIIIDEAFIEFTGKRNFSFLEEIEKYKCIFIIRALTKFYAMPGIRFGYGISKNKIIIDKIKSKQNPWNINCFAETAVKYVLKDKNYIEESLQWIEREREFMYYRLKNVKIIGKAYKTYANFILCKIEGTSCEELYKFCLENGIIIRRCENFKGLSENYIRLAIKDRKSNEKILELLHRTDFM